MRLGEALERRRRGMVPQLNPATEMAAEGSRGGLQHAQQWGQQETRGLISIRAEVEQGGFTATPWAQLDDGTPTTVWQQVASRMGERGYHRSPDECMYKWESLVSLYKRKKASDPENHGQCPFFEELNAVFMDNARNMQHLLLEPEPGTPRSTKKLKRRLGEEEPSHEFSEDNKHNDDDRPPTSGKTNAGRGRQRQAASKPKTGSSVHDQLRGLLQQQQEAEAQWREMMDRRAEEQRMFEQGWRLSVEELERERVRLERAWWEREEQRRSREEERAERRDALLTTLLTKLIHEGL